MVGRLAKPVKEEMTSKFRHFGVEQQLGAEPNFAAAPLGDAAGNDPAWLLCRS